MLLIFASAHTSVENHMAPHLTQASIWHLSLIENYCWSTWEYDQIINHLQPKLSLVGEFMRAEGVRIFPVN